MLLSPVTRPLTESLLTVYNSEAAGCYARTQKEEEVHKYHDELAIAIIALVACGLLTAHKVLS